MTMISIVQTASRDAYMALLAGLESQYGRGGGVEIACEFLKAEAAEFHWDSRTMERHLGRYESAIDDDDTGEELERIAILGLMKGAWFVAICIVDGDGAVQDMHALKLMHSAWDAHDAFDLIV